MENSMGYKMNRDIMISVIVPVYNDAKYIDRCVDSIRKQTYKNLEIILVDDGSADESGRLCDGYASKDKRIKVIHKENEGLVSAWTAGFELSTAPYISFVDGDDWIEKDMIEKMAARLVENKKDAAGSADAADAVDAVHDAEDMRSAQIICESGVIDRPDGTSEKMYHGLRVGEYDGKTLEDIHKQILGNEKRTISMSRCMKLISRELISDNIGYTDRTITMGEDVTIMLPALLDAKRVVIIEGSFDYHYVYNNLSMVHAYDPGMRAAIEKLCGVIRRVLADKKTPDGESQAQKEYLYLMMLVMKNELRDPGRDCSRNIRSICLQEKLSDKMKMTPIEVHDTANWMIANMMMHPQRWVIWSARMAMGHKMKQNAERT